MLDLEDSSNLIRNSWKKFSPLPGGKYLFSKAIGQIVPYSGSIGAVFESLEAGKGEARLRDRRAVRNHLNSIHAIALVNLAELCSGITLLYSLPAGMRGILGGFSIEYLKKARGEVRAFCDFTPPTSSESQDFKIDINIKNSEGIIVAKAQANWRIGPTRKEQKKT